MLLKIWVQIPNLSALGCKHKLSILIINITYECIFIFSLQNVLNKSSNPIYVKNLTLRLGEAYINCVHMSYIEPLRPLRVNQVAFAIMLT